MPSIKLAGVVVVVLTLSAAAPASASLPEFLGTASLTGAGGESLFEEETGGKWLYKAGSIVGKITGAKVAEGITLTFTKGLNGCDTSAGQLSWVELTGRLGYISKAGKEVGLLLESKQQPFAPCKFLGIGGFAYEGAAIAHITPVNTKTTKFTLSFKQEKAVQRPLAFEGEKAFPLVKGTCEVNAKLECIGLKETRELGISTTLELTTAKEVEIDA